MSYNDEDGCFLGCAGLIACVVICFILLLLGLVVGLWKFVLF